MSGAGHWVNHLDPIALRLHGDFGIRWYGLAYAAAFVIGAWLLSIYYKRGRSPLDPNQQSTLLFACMLGVLAGGRLGYVLLYDWPATRANPLTVFQIWNGGMASHGGFAGVILACLWAARQFRISPLSLGDIVVTLTPPGLLLGRVANFINGELWGRISNAPWAVIFPLSAPDGTPVQQIAPRHPSQLYEAALEGLLLLVFTQTRLWKTDVLKKPGRLSGEFLCLYAVVRVIGEQFREPDAPLIFGVSRGIFYSIFLFIGGLLLILRKGSVRAYVQ